MPQATALLRVARAAVRLLALCTFAGPALAQAPPRPTLVVVITVDQMRGDYLERALYSGAFARLAREGAVFTRAYQDHGITETAPGHSTILSGRYPASTGIVRNDEGVPDPRTPLVDGPEMGASPFRFSGAALVDWMRSRDRRSRALSVAGKDRAAILAVGRAREAVYWWKGGRFTTSRWYADSLPAWVREFNAGVAAAVAGRAWTPLLPLDAYGVPDSMLYENDGDAVFPHRLSTDSAIAAGTVELTPWGDSLTLAFALEGIARLGLGRGPHADLVHVGVSGTDHIGHRFGPTSVEVLDLQLRLDRFLGAFLDSLERRQPGRVLVVLTSDHGITAFPEWANMHGDTGAANITGPVDSIVRAARGTLADRLGAGRWIPWREVGMVAIDRPGLRSRGVDADSLADAMAAELRRVPGVARVDTRRTLAAATDTARESAVRRWRRMLAPGTPGEVFITPVPGRVLGSWRRAQHGAPTDDDAWVPLVLWGPGIRQGRHADPVAVVDIAPTLARILGVRPTERLDGRVLVEALR